MLSTLEDPDFIAVLCAYSVMQKAQAGAPYSVNEIG